MNNYKKIFAILIISTCSILLISCHFYIHRLSNVDLGDGGLLSDKPCSAPCFQNITPGITTLNQAKEIFYKTLNLKYCDSSDNLSKGGSKFFYCNNIGVELNRDDIVIQVYYIPVEPIILKDIINKYGAPNCYFLAGSGVENGMPYTMLLYFNNKHMIIYFPEKNEYPYILQEDTIIQSFDFLEKGHYLSYTTHCEKWKGYGGY